MISDCAFKKMAEMDFSISRCAVDEYLMHVITIREMTYLLPRLKQLDMCANLDQFAQKQGISQKILREEYDISKDLSQKWEIFGFSEFDKRALMFRYATNVLEAMRYHVCDNCGSGFFSTDPSEELCDRCAAMFGDKYNCEH